MKRHLRFTSISMFFCYVCRREKENRRLKLAVDAFATWSQVFRGAQDFAYIRSKPTCIFGATSAGDFGPRLENVMNDVFTERYSGVFSSTKNNTNTLIQVSERVNVTQTQKQNA